MENQLSKVVHLTFRVIIREDMPEDVLRFSQLSLQLLLAFMATAWDCTCALTESVCSRANLAKFG